MNEILFLCLLLISATQALRCGPKFGSCPLGQCCGKNGYCGITKKFCSVSKGCQSEYGNCKCGNEFGSCPADQCCSKKGYCGNTDIYCSSENGCQSEFGLCKCGKNYGSCNAYQCCSIKGYCGTTDIYCSSENGCQSEFGLCKCGMNHGSCNADQCCSKNGYCGKTTSFCSASKGCQSKFGKCNSFKILIAGDSTVESKMGNYNQTVGWGKYLSNYVTVPVYNYAFTGASTRTFIREGKWKKLINNTEKGDFVFIEFGHNDKTSPINEKEKGCIVGSGNETLSVTLSSGKTEVVHTYPWYIRQMIKQVLAKEAHPILLTNTPIKIFKEGKIIPLGKYSSYLNKIANSFNIPLIDMYNYIARRYEIMGEDYLDKNGFFPYDFLHTSPIGANLNAKVLINAFANCEVIPELAAILNDKGKAIKLSCNK